MKDKQRFFSSVIVSLIAGFIYYQFGQDIQQNFEKSIKAVLSSNDIDQYLPADCQPLNEVVKNSDNKNKIKISKSSVKKKNTLKFKSKDGIIPADVLLSGIISNRQATVQRSVPDRNIDFTAELESLIKTDASKSFQNPSKVSKSIRKSDNEIADTKEFKSKSNFVHKDKSDLNSGNGFEYNYMVHESGSKIMKNDSKFNYECKKEIKKIKSMKYEIKYKTYNSDKSDVNIIVPKVKTKVNKPEKVESTEEFESPEEVEAPEINIQIEDSEDDPM